jgi:hypothetical protein
MERQKKIELLQRIEAAELSPNILNVEKGLYLRTDQIGIYRNESGYDVKYPEIIEQGKILSLLCEFTTITGDELPYFIRVTPFPVGWMEFKEYASIHVSKEAHGISLINFWRKE